MQELAEQLRRARSEGGAFLLPDRLRIRLSGSDALRYLNGQITRELSRLETGTALSSCILTPKGKLCAPLLIHREGDDLLVESASCLEEILMARLERYIVADDVTLTLDAPRSVIHLFGKLIDAEPWASVLGLRTIRLGFPGLDIPAATPEAESLPLLDPRVVEALRIERGIPAWGSELGEETLPPEAGLDRTHIDYDRGCYPGQEVISRLKSIGRVNRLLRLFRASGASAPLTPGMTLLSGKGKEVGALTSVATQFDTGSLLALGYLGRGAVEPLFALDPLTGEKTPLSIIKSLGS
ncbi:MAG: YgfZ/GcvT domain-containing protein [Chthoniobacterales bacterium]